MTSADSKDRIGARSKEYFHTTEFRYLSDPLKKGSENAKPDWQPAYKTSNASNRNESAANGDANPFRFNSS